MMHVLFPARCATGLHFLRCLWLPHYQNSRYPRQITNLEVRKQHAMVEIVRLLSHKPRVWLFASFTEKLILCLLVLLLLKQVKERQRKKQTVQPSPLFPKLRLTEEQWPKGKKKKQQEPTRSHRFLQTTGNKSQSCYRCSATSGVLCPVRGSPVEERHGHTGPSFPRNITATSCLL